MNIENDISSNILLPAVGFFCIYYFFCKKYIISYFDALFTFILSLAFSSVLVINIVEEPRYITHFFICQFFLFFGFSIIQKLISFSPEDVNKPLRFYDLVHLKYTVYILFAIYIVANLILFYVKGVALLSDDPNAAKVSNFQQGFGLFRKINWAIGGFLCAGLIILYLCENKRWYIILILILAFFIASDGSKSSLLRIIVIGVFLAKHPYFLYNQVAIRSLNKFAPVVIIAIGFILYTILSKGNTDFSSAFLKRLLYGADNVIYFYQPQNEYFLTDFGFIDYINHITNPLLAFFRLTTYDEAIGNIIVDNTTPPGIVFDVIVGPNTPYYIEGQIYFGYYGAFIYSFIIGAIYSYIRQLFFSLEQSSFFFLALLCTLCFHGANILVESTLFITTCFDTCFFVVPVYVMVYFFMNGKLVIHKTRFSIFNKPSILPLR